jgi:hypothetical protein
LTVPLRVAEVEWRPLTPPVVTAGELAAMAVAATTLDSAVAMRTAVIATLRLTRFMNTRGGAGVAVIPGSSAGVLRGRRQSTIRF